MFDTQMIVDADWADDGWEVVVRHDAESMEAAWSGVSDEQLPSLIGEAMAASIIAERDRHNAPEPAEQAAVLDYATAIRVAGDLIESPENATLSNEYTRGICELLGDLFGQEGIELGERKEQVCRDIEIYIHATR